MGNDTSAPKKLFEQLDKTKDGVLTLDDLLNGNFTQSPLLLFRFDDGEDGALDREEFEKWVRHLQAHKKKHKKKRRTEIKKNNDKKKKQKKQKQNRHRHKDNARPEEEEEFSHAWTTLDENTASKLKLSRNSETPCIIGQGSPQLSHLESQLGGLSRRSDEFQGLLSEEAKAFLINLLRRSEGRKRYMDWLFRLADVDKDGDIEVDELNLILKALEKDGIRVSDLSYEKCIDPTKVGQRLLEEYATNKSGTLTREEFMVLADLIMRHYEEGYARTRKRRIGRYELKRKLGSGANSIVRLAINTETGEKKAIKVIKRGDVSDMSRIDVELKAMMMLDHPSIVKLHEVLENEEYVFFVMELCGGGSLSNYVEMKPLSERLARYYMPQLIKGLKYCHNKGVCHRDLKLENLLIDNNGHLKISDFGHAGIYREGWDLFNTRLVGSLYHLSPEQVQGQCYSGEKIDIWAVGVILYRLLVGKPPFFSRNPQEFLACVAQAKFETPEHLSKDAKDLIDMILQPDPANRPSCSKILKHPWFDGPVKEPALARYVLQLDSRFEDYNVPCNRIKEIVAALNIHVFPSNTAKRHHLLMYKCVYPKKELKFSITLKKRKYSKGNPYLEFNLHEGEGWEFNEAVYKIRATFHRWKKSIFPPGSSRNDISDASSSESESSDSNDTSDSSDSTSTTTTSSDDQLQEEQRRKKKRTRRAVSDTGSSTSDSESPSSSSLSDDERRSEEELSTRGHRRTRTKSEKITNVATDQRDRDRPKRARDKDKTLRDDAQIRTKERARNRDETERLPKERTGRTTKDTDDSDADRASVDTKAKQRRQRSCSSEEEEEEEEEETATKQQHTPKRSGTRRNLVQVEPQHDESDRGNVEDKPVLNGRKTSASLRSDDVTEATDETKKVFEQTVQPLEEGTRHGQASTESVQPSRLGEVVDGAPTLRRGHVLASSPEFRKEVALASETGGPQKVKPSAHARADEDEACPEPDDGRDTTRHANSADMPAVTDTEGFADDEDDTTDDEQVGSKDAERSGHGGGGKQQHRKFTKRITHDTAPALLGSSVDQRGTASDHEEEGNEADEEDNDWDGEDEEESEEASEEGEQEDTHEGHEELELSLHERDQEDNAT